MLSRSFIVLVGLVAVVAFAASPPYPCTITDPATQYLYDLTNVWRDPSTSDDYSYVAPAYYTYFVNVCGNTKFPCSEASGVCQLENLYNVTFSTGNAANAVWSVLSNGTGVSLNYPGGSSSFACSSDRTSTLNIICDSTLTNVSAVIDSVVEDPLCHYTVSMRSQYACPVSSQATGSYSTITYLSGGLPFCSQCGANGQYACSNDVGNWVTSFPVRDMVPSGSVVTGVSVSLLGSYACTSSPVTLEVDINGVPVNIQNAKGPNACACSTCDGSWLFSSSYFPALDGYNYGSSNNITLVVLNGQLCLNSVNITISWEPPTYPGTEQIALRGYMNRYTSYKVCNSVGYDSSSSQSFTFTDPLPAGSLLIMANAQVFGSYWCVSGSSTPQISVSLVGTTIGTIKLPTKSYQASCDLSYQCDGGYWVGPSKLYQPGWAGYKYGGSNNFIVSTASSPRLGQIVLSLTYYSEGTLQTMQFALNDRD